MSKIVLAKTKYVDRTARKVRLVVDLIRGKKVVDAMAMLQFSNKAASESVIKTLKSAIANATNNFGMDKNELIITKAFVDDAPVYKRGNAISRGRYHQILKRNSHITIAVSDGKTETVKQSAVKSADKTEGKSETKVKSEKPVKKTVKKDIKIKKSTKNN